ncbi:MAG: hypothetical protein WDM76_07615 [Limisphaerales bacterium]
MRIDLPRVEFLANGERRKQYFVQLAGAGLDARAIELVDWQHKKKVGPLAYVIAGLKALREKKPEIIASVNGQRSSGELILIGSGRFYGGFIQNFSTGGFAQRVFGRLYFSARGLADIIPLYARFSYQPTITGKSRAAFSGGEF